MYSIHVLIWQWFGLHCFMIHNYVHVPVHVQCIHLCMYMSMYSLRILQPYSSSMQMYMYLTTDSTGWVQLFGTQPGYRPPGWITINVSLLSTCTCMYTTFFRLRRLIEILTNNWKLSEQLRVPATTKMQVTLTNTVQLCTCTWTITMVSSNLLYMYTLYIHYRNSTILKWLWNFYLNVFPYLLEWQLKALLKVIERKLSLYYGPLYSTSRYIYRVNILMYM